jgi:hypothetical protein
MSRNLPVRRTGPQVRRRPIRRASPVLSSLQLFGLMVMVGCAAAVWSLGASPQFAARKLEIHGARFTSGEAVRAVLGLQSSVNLFSLQTDHAAALLVRLPAVRKARVEVRLPDTVAVTLEERIPRMVWVIGEHRYVVDADGVLFGLIDGAGNPIPSTAGPIELAPTAIPLAPVPTATGHGSAEPAASAAPSGGPSPTEEPTRTPKPVGSAEVSPSPTGSPWPSASPHPGQSAPSLEPAPTLDPSLTPGPNAISLPVVYDRQAADAPLALGSVVDPIGLDAGYRLACRTPAEIASSAAGLVVIVDDEHGFTMSSVPAGWVAEFGFYTPTLRKVTVIPVQIADLRSLLLAKGEAHVAWVWLMADISEDRMNTYRSR